MQPKDTEHGQRYFEHRPGCSDKAAEHLVKSTDTSIQYISLNFSKGLQINNGTETVENAWNNSFIFISYKLHKSGVFPSSQITKHSSKHCLKHSQLNTIFN